MTASLLYRVSSMLLVLFAVGHTFGFHRMDPRWGVEAPIGALRSTQFECKASNDAIAAFTLASV